MPLSLFLLTVCFNNGAGPDVVIQGEGGSKDEALSDAVQKATGYKILWAVAPSNATVPSPAAPGRAGEALQGATFEDMHREAGSPEATPTKGATPGNPAPFTVPAPGPSGFVHTGDQDGPRNQNGGEGARNVVAENDFTGKVHDVEADNKAAQEKELEKQKLQEDGGGQNGKSQEEIDFEAELAKEEAEKQTGGEQQ